MERDIIGLTLKETLTRTRYTIDRGYSKEDLLERADRDEVVAKDMLERRGPNELSRRLFKSARIDRNTARMTNAMNATNN